MPLNSTQKCEKSNPFTRFSLDDSSVKVKRYIFILNRNRHCIRSDFTTWTAQLLRVMRQTSSVSRRTINYIHLGCFVAKECSPVFICSVEITLNFSFQIRYEMLTFFSPMQTDEDNFWAEKNQWRQTEPTSSDVHWRRTCTFRRIC